MTPRVELVEFGPEHFDLLIEWSPTPEFLMQWAGPSLSFPLDHAQLEGLRRESGRAFAVLEAGRVVGHAEIGRIDADAGDGWLMRVLIGDPADRSRGIGRAIVKALVRVAFGDLDLQRVYLHVLKTNEPAIALYRSLGFEPCDPILPRPDTVRAMVLTRTI